MWLYDTKLIPPMVATLEGMKNAHLAMRAQQQAQVRTMINFHPQQCCIMAGVSSCITAGAGPDTDPAFSRVRAGSLRLVRARSDVKLSRDSTDRGIQGSRAAGQGRQVPPCLASCQAFLILPKAIGPRGSVAMRTCCTGTQQQQQAARACPGGSRTCLPGSGSCLLGDAGPGPPVLPGCAAAAGSPPPSCSR